MAGRRTAHSRLDGDRGAALARLILDTTLLIDAERSRRALEDIIADDDDVAIAAVSLAELLVGAELGNARHRPARERYLAELAATMRVESYNASVAHAHGALLAHVRRAGRPRGAHDLIIAATAVERNRTVVSRDARGFADLPGVAVRSV